MTMNTANICQCVTLRLQKTLVFSITHKYLIINPIDCFNSTQNYESVSRTGVS